MNRRLFLRNSAFLASAAVLPGREWMARTLFANGEMTPLRRNVGLYTERGGSIAWLLTPEHAVVVDTQFQEQAQNLVGLMTETNAQPLDLLVNTHHHGDHTSGNIVFADRVATHVAHENSKANQERVAIARERMAETLLPTTTYTDTWSQRVGDETITLHYAGAAHTNGDSMVHFEEANIVHMGDLVFNRRFPYIDKSAGADIANWIRVLRSARRRFDKDTLYIFGHSGEGYQVTGSQADLRAMENYLRRLLRFMKRAIRKGQTLDQIKETVTVIPGAEEFTDGRISRSFDAAWAELVDEQ